MKKLFIILVLLLLWSAGMISAEPMSESQVLKATETFIRLASADARADATIDRMQPFGVEGEIYSYVAHLHDSGFCICGANDFVLPVYLYSPAGAFDSDNPELQFIIDGIKQATNYYRDGLQNNDPEVTKFSTELTERSSQWQTLISGGVPAEMLPDQKDRASPSTLVLPYENDWSQGSPYNDRCPELTPGADQHTLVGCVALSTAQVMDFWSWPSGATGIINYYYPFSYALDWVWTPLANKPFTDINTWNPNLIQWSSANGGQLGANNYWDGSIYTTYKKKDTLATSDYKTALKNLYYDVMTHDSTLYTVDLSETTYDWSLLEVDHSDLYPDDGDYMVSTICYHVGMSLGMMYAVWASASGSDRIPAIMSDTFSYDDDIEYVGFPTGYMTAMSEEICWHRPVIVNGPGHQWVVYGYHTGTNQYLMDMGWGGVDAWYTADSAGQGIPLNETMTRYIAPEGKVRFVDNNDLLMGGDGTPDNPYWPLTNAINSAPNNSILIMKTETVHELSGINATLSKPMILRGQGITLRKAGK